MVGVQKPTNFLVVVSGTPLFDERVVETAANVVPGALVKKGTASQQVVCGTAGCKPLGWVGFEQTAERYKPATIATAHSANDIISVLYGGHFIIQAILATSQTITEGDLLIAGATGFVTEASVMTASISETASEKHVTPTVTLTGSTAPSGPEVGIAVESVTSTSDTPRLAVLSLL